ncbi:Hypothetical_protein [Hexamita inflata]|uniref:Hypothetical_protein n=1 Tax=Hexamita inflata TaxID=28002 RepID=A0AA86UI43_9EUKA|nr:Hypothetical protein HINF_LOCUS44324 [Hexamita inflata]
MMNLTDSSPKQQFLKIAQSKFLAQKNQDSDQLLDALNEYSSKVLGKKSASRQQPVDTTNYLMYKSAIMQDILQPKKAVQKQKPQVKKTVQPQVPETEEVQVFDQDAELISFLTKNKTENPVNLEDSPPIMSKTPPKPERPLSTKKAQPKPQSTPKPPRTPKAQKAPSPVQKQQPKQQKPTEKQTELKNLMKKVIDQVVDTKPSAKTSRTKIDSKSKIESSKLKNEQKETSRSTSPVNQKTQQQQLTEMLLSDSNERTLFKHLKVDTDKIHINKNTGFKPEYQLVMQLMSSMSEIDSPSRKPMPLINVDLPSSINNIQPTSIPIQPETALNPSSNQIPHSKPEISEEKPELLVKSHKLLHTQDTLQSETADQKISKMQLQLKNQTEFINKLTFTFEKLDNENSEIQARIKNVQSVLNEHKRENSTLQQKFMQGQVAITLQKQQSQNSDSIFVKFRELEAKYIQRSTDRDIFRKQYYTLIKDRQEMQKKIENAGNFCMNAEDFINKGINKLQEFEKGGNPKQQALNLKKKTITMIAENELEWIIDDALSQKMQPKQ